MKRDPLRGRRPLLIGTLALCAAALAQPAAGAEHTLPFVLPAGNDALQAFIRIVNRSDQSGDVEIRAVDDTGDEAGQVTLSIGANSSRHFNSEDLELNELGKLSGGVGDGQCSWRLELETDLDILPLAFVRTGDGFVTSIHDIVPEVEPGRHDVAIFNPGKNMTQQSRLRLVNPGDTVAEAEISGIDDKGIGSQESVRVTVPAGGACMVTAAELESGETGDSCGCEVNGDGLGTGSGKWQLSVTTEQSIQVMSVLKTPEHLTNLSTVKYAGFAPPNESAFNARFVDRRVRTTDGTLHVDFTSSGRFRESYLGDTFEGGYTYTNQGPNSGTLVFDYDDGEECTTLAAFDSFIAGTILSVCEDVGELERQPIRSWVLVDIGPAGTAPADQNAFYARFRDKRLVPTLDLSGSFYYLDILTSTRFREFEFRETHEGTYTYGKTGANSAALVLAYDNSDRCDVDVTFDSETSGGAAFACISDRTTTVSWQAMDRP